jgi:hypothetical protein
MKKAFIQLCISLLFWWSCEESEDCSGEPGGDNICGCTDSTATNYDSTATSEDGTCEYDSTGPIVNIINPQDGSTVSEVVIITCISTDNIKYVELWINGVSTGVTDNKEPYTLEWNTVPYNVGSIHTISVWSYDVSGNKTESDPVTLIVNNTNSLPTPVLLYPVLHRSDHLDDYFIITWSKNDNDDFLSYILYESSLSDMSGQIKIFTTTTNTDTTHVVPGTNILYYQIVIQDIWGLHTISNIESSYTYPGVSFSGSGDDGGYSVQQTNDNGYIIVGHTESLVNGTNNIWLIKTDLQGREEWNHSFGGTENDVGYAVQPTYDGGYIITGQTESFGNGSSDIWLIKTNSEGIEEWNNIFGGGYYDASFSIQTTQDGGYIIAGSTQSFGNGTSDVWLIKTDSQGNEEWNKTFGGSYYDGGSFVQQTTDDGYIITGVSQYQNLWLIKTDSLGNEQWEKTFDESIKSEGNCVQQTTDNGYIITGYTGSYPSDAWLIKTDSEGNEQWNRIFGGSGNDKGNSVQQSVDGGYIIAGQTESFGNGWIDLWLIKTDREGNEEWNKTFGGTVADFGQSVRQSVDGGYIITGTKDWNESGSADLWLIKTDSDGNEVLFGE